MSKLTVDEQIAKYRLLEKWADVRFALIIGFVLGNLFSVFSHYAIGSWK